MTELQSKDRLIKLDDMNQVVLDAELLFVVSGSVPSEGK